MICNENKVHGGVYPLRRLASEMTTREFFAAAIMHAMLSYPRTTAYQKVDADGFAVAAVHAADALLSALQAPK